MPAVTAATHMQGEEGEWWQGAGGSCTMHPQGTPAVAHRQYFTSTDTRRGKVLGPSSEQLLRKMTSLGRSQKYIASEEQCTEQPENFNESLKNLSEKLSMGVYSKHLHHHNCKKAAAVRDQGHTATGQPAKHHPPSRNHVLCENKQDHRDTQWGGGG